MTAALDEGSLAALVRRTRLVAFDFDGVFTDNTVFVFEDGREAVRCWRSDGLGLRLLEKHGVTPIVMSTEANPLVVERCKKLRVRCLHGLGDKGGALDDVAREAGLPLDALAFVGNDINDRGCLERVGFPIVVADAHPAVAPLGRYRTQARGGRGAVREVCDLFDRVLGGGAARVPEVRP